MQVNPEDRVYYKSRTITRVAGNDWTQKIELVIDGSTTVVVYSEEVPCERYAQDKRAFVVWLAEFVADHGVLDSLVRGDHWLNDKVGP